MAKEKLIQEEINYFVKLGKERHAELESLKNKFALRIEKEKELFATMIREPEKSLEIFNKVSFDMVSNEHRDIFEAISQIKSLDAAGITWELSKRNYSSLKEVLDLSISILPNVSLRLKEYFEVCDSIQADKFLSEAVEGSKNQLHGLDTLTELQDKIEVELNKYSRFERPKTFDENLDEILLRIESKLKKDNSLKTNTFPSFNTATGGLNDGNLIGIAGAFKNGKTTFGLNLILDFAEQKIPAVIFTLEMSRSEIEEKIVAYKTGISNEKLRNPQRLSEDDRKSLIRFSSQRKKSDEKLFIYDKMFSITEIETTVKKLRASYGVKIVLLDYIGLVKSIFKHRNIESREREISQLSNSLKILAKESGTSILVLSQLNRSGIKEATSMNLAESIALARESDFLFTIYKPELNGYNKVKLDGKEIQINENDFIVKLDASRHTQSGKEFLLRLDGCGKMNELETRFDNSYAKKSIKNYYENESDDFPQKLETTNYWTER